MSGSPPSGGLRRAVLVLLAGGALAQALPLLLGPWLTRLYTPEDFGHWHLFAAVAANVAVVACARYEFALPVATAAAEAAALRALCLRLLAIVTGLSAVCGLAWALASHTAWPLALPLAVAALGGLSLATLLATRDQRFGRLSLSRVLQHGGGAVLQAIAGLAQAGLAGLIAGPLLAAAAAGALLGWRSPGTAPPGAWRETARRYRDYPLLNTPHAFLGALQDTLSVALVAFSAGPAAAGAWGLVLRYLKAPATLVGGAVSQALHPRLGSLGRGDAGRRLVRRTMLALALPATGLAVLLGIAAPWLFTTVFGPQWALAGDLARALAPYVALHFVASPLGVVTMAWDAQAWALRLAVVGQAAFVLALAAGLAWGGLVAAGWAVSAVMGLYFGWYFFRLATWPAPPGERA
jgi:O-antigen/teichoic acid export membrane protein